MDNENAEYDDNVEDGDENLLAAFTDNPYDVAETLGRAIESLEAIQIGSLEAWSVGNLPLPGESIASCLQVLQMHLRCLEDWYTCP